MPNNVLFIIVVTCFYFYSNCLRLSKWDFSQAGLFVFLKHLHNSLSILDNISISVGTFCDHMIRQMYLLCSLIYPWLTFSLKGIVSAEWSLLFTNQGMVGCVFIVTHGPSIPGSFSL